MCDRVRSDKQIKRDNIKELRRRISDAKYYKTLYLQNARDEISAGKARAKNERELARKEREQEKALRLELREMLPARKPRKAKGFPVTNYFEPSPARELVTADFERYSNGFNVYD